MRPSKATSGRRGSAGVSSEQERTSFKSGEFLGVERDQTPVYPHTSLIGPVSLLDGRAGYPAEDDNPWFIDQSVEDHRNSYKRTGIGGGGAASPRSFPYSVKQQCWEKAEKVKGRDPERWRRDPLGNIIFRKLVGCPGCLCHDYDHIIPYSKGGQSTLDNCQVLQATVNRSKGNKTEISKSDLIQKSAYCRVSGRDMDLVEISAYGNVRRGQDSSACSIQ